MPITAFLHTHVLVVVLFLLLFTAKAVLLLLNKIETLEKVRSYTKILDIIFGTLILITGGYLIFNYNGIPTWLIVKIVLVLIAIPLGIVGLKRHNKVLAVLAFLIFIYVYGVAETKSLTMKKDKGLVDTTTKTVASPDTDAVETGQPAQSKDADQQIIASMSESSLTNAKAIYVQVCATCHGEDGTKGTSGAVDLTGSSLSLSDRKEVILHGRGLMPAFGEQLSEQEAEELAAYTMTLKK
jgi:mono/diheme cytochrome c family protein/uncharacterized membrane protein SirB2